MRIVPWRRSSEKRTITRRVEASLSLLSQLDALALCAGPDTNRLARRQTAAYEKTLPV